MGPLVNRDGTIAVNRRKCPTLYRCLERGLKSESDQEWGRVVLLRMEGKQESADRLARKLLGVKGPEMSEEVKEKLRAYNEANKDKIAARRKTQRAIRRAISKPAKERRR